MSENEINMDDLGEMQQKPEQAQIQVVNKKQKKGKQSQMELDIIKAKTAHTQSMKSLMEVYHKAKKDTVLLEEEIISMVDRTDEVQEVVCRLMDQE